MKNLTLLLIVCCLGTGLILAQEQPIVEIQNSTVEQIDEHRKLVRLTVAIKDGFHIQANKLDDPYLIPTTVELDRTNAIIAHQAQFPAGHILKIAGMADPLMVYDGRIEVLIPIELSLAAQTGSHIIAGKLNYQACDNVRCFRPRELPFTVNIEVEN